MKHYYLFASGSDKGFIEVSEAEYIALNSRRPTPTKH